jgi:hypothetical protein
MKRSYIVPMRWMVIYEYEVPGGALNLSSTKISRPWSPWQSSPSRKNSHGRIGNRTWDHMISSQKLRPLDQEAGFLIKCSLHDFYNTIFISCMFTWPHNIWIFLYWCCLCAWVVIIGTCRCDYNINIVKIKSIYYALVAGIKIIYKMHVTHTQIVFDRIWNFTSSSRSVSFITKHISNSLN